MTLPSGSSTASELAGLASKISLLPNAGSSGTVVGVAAGAAVAAVAATATLTYFAYRAYETHKVKKHRALIEKVNQLHHKYLENIKTPNDEVISLPPIFKLSPDENSPQAESLHLTDEQIEKLDTSPGDQVDIALTIYMEAIGDIINGFKDYYSALNDKEDDESAVIKEVLVYLMYVYSQWCLKFQGYGYDIAYNKALRNFITALATLDTQTRTTQIFSRLRWIRKDCVAAIKSLEEHNRSLSLNDMVKELRKFCLDESKNLIKDLAGFFVASEHSNVLKRTKIKYLASGLIQPHYVRSNLGRLELSSDKTLKLPRSIFTDWIMKLSKYYEVVLDPNTLLNDKNISSPAQIFTFPNLERLAMLEKQMMNFKANNLGEVVKIEEQMKSISSTLGAYENFLTRKLEDKKDSDKLVSIHDRKELIARTKILANFATLTHQLISLLYLCTHLLKCIQQLGEIYAENPKHFATIFVVFENLCQQVKDGIDNNLIELLKLKDSHDEDLQYIEFHLFPDQVISDLERVNARVSSLSERINSYRRDVQKNKFSNGGKRVSDSRRKKIIIKQTFDIAILLGKIYNIKCDVTEAQPQLTIINEGKEEESEEYALDHTSPSPVSSPTIVHHTPPQSPVPATEVHPTPPVASMTEPAIVPQADTPTVSSPLPSIQPPSATTDTMEDTDQPTIVPPSALLTDDASTDTSSLKINLLTSIATEISNEIAKIEKTEMPQDTQAKQLFNEEMTAYKKLNESLQDLVDNTKKMLLEKNPTAERGDKTNQTSDLTIKLCTQARDFLKLPKDERRKQAAELTQLTQEDLSPKNEFINRPKSQVPRFLYQRAHITLFSTHTHKALVDVRKACDKIATALNKTSRPVAVNQ